MNLAFKDILHNKLRFIITSIGLGLLLSVVMAMSGIYAGFIFEATTLVETLNHDLWVVQKDTFGPFADTSKISEEYYGIIGAIDGVKDINALTFQTIQAVVKNQPKRLTIVGLKKNLNELDAKIIEGRNIINSHYEIVSDASTGLVLDEIVKIGYDDFKVVGIMKGIVNSSGEPVIFMKLQDAQKIQFQKNNEAIRNDKIQLKSSLNLNENSPTDVSKMNKIYNNHVINAIIIKADNFKAPEIAQKIEKWNYFKVFTSAEEMDILSKNVIEKPKKQLGLFKTILLIASTAIITLIIYTLTQDKVKDIATLKLIGTPLSMIIGLILNQAIAMGTIGYCIAFTIISNTYHFFPRRIVLLPFDMASLYAIVMAMCIFASLIGIKKALSIDINQAIGG